MTSRPTSGGRRRVDLLQYEADHGRITSPALDVGRRLQLALEATHRSGGSAWGAKVDAPCSGDNAAVSAVEATRRAARLVDWAGRASGQDSGERLAVVLADGSGFAEAASRTGRTGRRATSEIAASFRDALERLALAQEAVGAVPTKVTDKHSRAAETLSARNGLGRAA